MEEVTKIHKMLYLKTYSYLWLFHYDKRVDMAFISMELVSAIRIYYSYVFSYGGLQCFIFECVKLWIDLVILVIRNY